ncbi:MAG: PDZ domain-containing protein, partial [Planctomycetota bacterium]
ETGTVVSGFLGVGIQDLTPELARSFGIDERNGVVVSKVEPGSPAADGGLEEQDVVVRYRGKDVKNVGHFRNKVAMTEPGATVGITVLREGERKQLEVTIGRRPGEMVATADGSQIDQAYGLAVADLTQEAREEYEIEVEQGVVVTGVEAGSSAADAGLRVGQVIVGVNRARVANTAEFATAMDQASQTGRPIRLIIRQGNWNVLVVLEPPRE